MDSAADPDSLVAAAMARLDTEPRVAEANCRQALAIAKGHVGALAALGYLVHAGGRHGEAEQIYTELTLLEPAEAGYWMNLGTARRCNRRHDAALAAYAKAAELGGTTADFYYNVGLAHLERRDYESARAVLKLASELAPKDAEIRFEYARACYESLQTEEAIAALAGWQELPDLDQGMIAGIGQRLMNLGETERAQQAIRELGGIAELEPRAALTLVQILERTNRLDESRALLDRLAIDPRAGTLGVDLTLAEAQLAQRESRHESAAALFSQALDQSTDFASRHFELFPLARSLDALGRHSEAFATLAEAHRSQVQYLQQTAPLATLRGAPTLLIADYGCDPADVARWDHAIAPSAQESPIFIVAFPRSGTTLLELVLDAHPDLRSMDEQAFLQNALDDILGFGAKYPEELAPLTATQLATVRERYWERVGRKLRLEAGQRLVDKNPLNMLRLPVIRRVFPHARVVLAIRHPLDVMLSCYMQHFRAPEFALLCSDLRTLASGYRRSFDFWYRQAEILEAPIREIRYESFVARFEDETRALAAFLEIPWHDAMLEPGARARDKRYISTPSYAQVVQPVNARAVGRWRAYAEQLAPVIPVVRPYLVRWGYEV